MGEGRRIHRASGHKGTVAGVSNGIFSFSETMIKHLLSPGCATRCSRTDAGHEHADFTARLSQIIGRFGCQSSSELVIHAQSKSPEILLTPSNE
eukprot:scaffold27601_cov69-Cyclotella_meneghiniana.AAC.7